MTRALMVPMYEPLTLVDLIRRPAWYEHAACKGQTRAYFPSRGEDVRPAKQTCSGCAVRDECLEYAMSLPGYVIGIWGGLSERERRRLRRTRAVVTRAA